MSKPPQYIFGRTKVHPEPPPPLDPTYAPWSAPRGYTTSMAEEANALKVAARAGRAKVKVAGGAPAPLPAWHKSKPHQRRIKTPNIFIKVCNHLRAVCGELTRNLRGNPHKFLAKLCCLSAEVD